MTTLMMILFGLAGGLLGYALHRSERINMPQWQAVCLGALGGVLGGMLFQYLFLILMALLGAALVLVVVTAALRRR